MFDGCTNVTYANNLFLGADITTIPEYVRGFNKLNSCTNMFNNTLITEIPYGLFKNINYINSSSGIFASCKQLAGWITKDCLNKLGRSSLNQAFANTKIAGIAQNKLVDAKGNNLMEYEINNVYDTVTSIDGQETYALTYNRDRYTFNKDNKQYTLLYNRVLDSDNNVVGNIVNNVFTMPSTREYVSEENNAFYGIQSSNLTAIFQNCQIANDITESLEVLSKNKNKGNLVINKIFYNNPSLTFDLGKLLTLLNDGVFATAYSAVAFTKSAPQPLANKPTISENICDIAAGLCLSLDGFNPSLPVQLGGSLARIGTKEEGKLLLKDRTLVEVKDYTWNDSNPPIALATADVKIDETLQRANLEYRNNLSDTGTRRLFGRVLKAMLYLYCNGIQYYFPTGSIKILNNTIPNRFYGAQATKELYDLVSNDATRKNQYPAITNVYNYTSDGIKVGDCYLPDTGDSSKAYQWSGFLDLLSQKYKQLDFTIVSQYGANTAINTSSNLSTIGNENIFYSSAIANIQSTTSSNIYPCIKIK